MFDPTIFNLLYANVLHDDILKDKIKDRDIRDGVRIMASLYAPKPESLQIDSITVPNFNFASHRIAYLHKYAAFHTALVYEMMQLILNNQWQIFDDLMMSGKKFKLCCLGGGPGSDAIGVLAALSTSFDGFMMDVTIVDIMENWKLTFASVVNELLYGNYGSLGTAMQKSLEWDYIGANLLGSMSGEVNKAIGGADLVTMVKFVSAAACQDTEEMMRKIFNTMKPGAMVLFIDNAAGGFSQLIRRAASVTGLVTKFGPLQHFHYSNPSMLIERFGYSSCCETRVTVHLLQKSNKNKKFRENISNCPPKNANAVRIYQPLSTQENIPNVDIMSSNFKPPSTYSNPTPAHLSNQENIPNCPPKNANAVRIHQPLSTQENIPNVGIMSSNFKPPSTYSNPTPARLSNQENIPNVIVKSSSFEPLSRNNPSSSLNYNHNVNKTISEKNNLSKQPNSQVQKKKSNRGRAQGNRGIRNDGYSYTHVTSPTSSNLTPASEANTFPESQDDTCCNCCVIS